MEVRFGHKRDEPMLPVGWWQVWGAMTDVSGKTTTTPVWFETDLACVRVRIGHTSTPDKVKVHITSISEQEFLYATRKTIPGMGRAPFRHVRTGAWMGGQVPPTYAEFYVETVYPKVGQTRTTVVEQGLEVFAHDEAQWGGISVSGAAE
jgi:hypothetical protein